MGLYVVRLLTQRSIGYATRLEEQNIPMFLSQLFL